ncbi:potassium channel family protein [Flavisolibacter ginsengisoli]|jgi:hypothetical protein|uniref:Ion channel n=1 Tax=Flavisolibacter ginsengisoli DSM 18119 TaxID=1121884 RepID=A0A1M5EMP4_9BACT|nr:potassium channel family protein [Flavisolibacter ginsengisoli]SHF80371.1 Ion channel [Flavisolibacter ginsengisoli DSM 18119]
MSEVAKIVHAPKVDPRILWQMSAEDFTAWRKEHDYPRIISVLKHRLSEFETWMEDQVVSDELLIQYSPSTFLKEDPIFIYKVLHDNKEEKDILLSKKYAINQNFFHNNLVKQRKDVVPYPIWYRHKFKKRPPGVSVNQRSGRSHVILSGLELLDVGNCQISHLFLGHRKLDFVNMSDLIINNCFNNASLELSFSSAYNLTIQGDLPFLDAYQTSFAEWISTKASNLKLLNGTFQRWRFIDCDINVFADNAVIQLWEVVGEYFDATITSTDVRDCTFKSSPIHYPIQLGRAKVYHANIKRLFSQLGKKGEASKHYYLEKAYERKTFLHVRENHREALLRKQSKLGKALVRLAFRFQYVQSAFLNLLWGYGERPARVFAISIATIFLFALAYCYLPDASGHTYHKFANALYYSMVTFTTLGYGDISQTTAGLKLLSGFEALLGMSFWGILIAGFTNNAKDY